MTSSRIGQATVALFFVCTLVLPYIGGSPLALFTAVLILGMSLWQLAQRPKSEFDPGAAMLLTAFVLLAIVFAITSRPGTLDVVYVLNFILFVFFSPLSNALSRLATPDNTKRVAWFALAGAILAFGVALVQVALLHYRRAAGWGSNPIPSSTVALFLGFVALIGFIAERSSRRYLFLAGPLAGIGTVLLSGSRGPLLAIPVLTLVAIFLLPIRRAVLVGIFALALVAGGMFVALNPGTLDRFMAVGEAASQIAAGETVDADKSTRIRASIFAASYAAFLESPWIGYGWGGRVPPVAARIDGVFSQVDKHSHLHSDIVDFALSAGVVGILAYVLIVLAPVASAIASPRDTQFRARLYGVLILSSGYVICGAVNKLLGFEYMTTFYIALAAILLGYCRDAPPSALPAPAGGKPASG